MRIPGTVAGNHAQVAGAVFQHRVGVIGELPRLVRARQVKAPAAALVMHSHGIGIARIIRHVIARVRAFFQSCLGVGIRGIGVQAGERAGCVEAVVERRFQALVVGRATVEEGGVQSAAHRLDLVVELDVEQGRFGRQAGALPAPTQFHGFRQFRLQGIVCRLRVELGVLHGAKRTVVVGEHRHVIAQQVGHVQRGQGLVVEQLDLLFLRQVIDALRLDMFVAHTGRDAPGVDRDLVVDIDRLGIGAVVGKARRRLLHAAGDHHVIDRLVGPFAQVAVADRHVMRHAARLEALRVARLERRRFVIARLVAQAGAGRIDQGALARAFVVVGAHFQFLGGGNAVQITDVGGLALAAPEVATAGVLERVKTVLRLRQAARRARGHVVVRQLAVDLGRGAEVIAEFQCEIIELFIAGRAPVAARHARIQQGQAQAAVELAAGKHAVLRVVAVALAIAVMAYAGVARDALAGGDAARLEVDDAAHVLRPEAHRATAAHHVHRFHIGQADGCERQLRLAIRCHRHRDAVEQHRAARRVAPRQAAHADIERHGAARTARVVADLHAGNAAHHIADAGRARVLDLFLLHHAARAGEILGAGGHAGAEQIAADLDRFEHRPRIIGRAALLRLRTDRQGQAGKRNGQRARAQRKRKSVGHDGISDGRGLDDSDSHSLRQCARWLVVAVVRVLLARYGTRVRWASAPSCILPFSPTPENTPT